MKFITLAFYAALFSFACAEPVHIYPYIESPDPSLNGKYLSLVRYKANEQFRNDITYTDNYGTFFFDSDKYQLWNPATEDSSGFINYLNIHNGYLITVPELLAKVELIDSVLFVLGNSQFYVLNGLIYVFQIEGSTPIKIKASTSPLIPDRPSSPIPPSSPTPNPSGYTNTTITTTLTYTEGHTTVVTVTTCPPTVTDCPARHTPQVVTTIIPVTKTTTYCPATTTPTYVPYTSYTEYTAYTPTVAGESTVKTTAPVTEVPNGAAKAGSIAGIGMLAAAAYLF